MTQRAAQTVTLSQLLGRRLAGGFRISDLLVLAEGPTWPVRAVRSGDTFHLAYWHDNEVAIGAIVDGTGLVSLKHDVLDRQIVDVDDRRVVRVGDVALAPIDRGLEAVALEIGIRPVLRRIGLTALTHRSDPDLIRLHDVTVAPTCIVAHTSLAHIGEIETHHLARLIRRLPHAMREDVLTRMPTDRAQAVSAHIASRPHRPRWRRYRTPNA